MVGYWSCYYFRNHINFNPDLKTTMYFPCSQSACLATPSDTKRFYKLMIKSGFARGNYQITSSPRVVTPVRREKNSPTCFHENGLIITEGRSTSSGSALGLGGSFWERGTLGIGRSLPKSRAWRDVTEPQIMQRSLLCEITRASESKHIQHLPI